MVRIPDNTSANLPNNDVFPIQSPRYHDQNRQISSPVYSQNPTQRNRNFASGIFGNSETKANSKSGISSILSGITGGFGEKIGGLKDGFGDTFGGISDGLGGVLSKFKNWEFETEDLIIMLIIYLMYRESKDEELLIILGVMLFL